MSGAMGSIKAVALAHVRRDLGAARQWICDCEPCRHFRDLVGIEKVLSLRPLLRELEDTDALLKELPDGPEKDAVRARYLKLHDDLAAAMAR